MIELKPSQIQSDRYYKAGYWQNCSLNEWINSAIESHSENIAVHDASGFFLKYRELNNLASRLAGFLRGRGIEAGDVITMHLPNWWQTAVITLAALKLGAVINPLPPTYGWKDLAFVMNKSASKAIFIAGRFRSMDYTDHIARVRSELKIAPEIIVIGSGNIDIGCGFEQALLSPPLEQEASVEADSPCLLLFTSGSESKPKGAVHTHNTAIFGERILAETLGLNNQDVCFMASPVTHTSGFMHGLLMTFMIGSTVSLLDVFKGDTAVEQMKVSRATWTMGATPFLNDVVESMEKSGQRLPDLRYFLCGGAPIPEAIVRRAQNLGIRVLSIYGSTESPPHTVTWPDDPVESAWKFDGRVLPGIEVLVADENGRALPEGEEGEEWSRGPNTFIGYLGEPDLTNQSLDVNGWYHSGDIAVIGENGSVRISGRIKDMIIRGGQNISAREVEDILLEHSACHQVSVIGIPDERLGEQGCAVVVCYPGKTLSFDEMKKYLIERGVARFKLPEYLVLRSSLPATPSGKIQKFKLREELKNINGGS